MKNIYLIKSLSYRVLDNKIHEITADSTNITTLSLNDISIYEVIDDASYLGLFNEARFIIIKDVKYFGGKFNYEEETAAISKFLENMDESINIIFVCDNILKSKELTKKALSLGAKIIDLSELEESEVIKIIHDYSKLNELIIDDKTINLLLKNANNDIDVALMEIDKLSTITNKIDQEIISTYSSVIESDVTFDFVDAVVQKKFNTVFSLLDKLLNNNTEVLGLISLLANRYTTIYIVKSANKDHKTDEEIADMLGFKNKGRLYYIRRDGKIYTLDELKEIIINLSILDKKIKTGTSPVYGLKELLLNL